MTQFEHLFIQAQPQLSKRALKLCGGIREDAEDLLQECALAAFSSFDPSAPVRKFPSWIMHILNKTRCHQHRAMVAQQDCKSEALEHASKVADLSAPDEDCFVFADVVERLPEMHRSRIFAIWAGEPAGSRSEMTLRTRARVALREALL